MRWTNFVVKALISLALALGMVCLLLLVVGSMRYGGPDGLLLRMRAEVAAHQPHPQLVPTPLLAASTAKGAPLPRITPPAGVAQSIGKQAATLPQAAKPAPQPIAHTAATTGGASLLVRARSNARPRSAT